jgi:hypothetical protein
MNEAVGEAEFGKARGKRTYLGCNLDGGGRAIFDGEAAKSFHLIGDGRLICLGKEERRCEEESCGENGAMEWGHDASRLRWIGWLRRRMSALAEVYRLGRSQRRCGPLRWEGNKKL